MVQKERLFLNEAPCREGVNMRVDQSAELESGKTTRAKLYACANLKRFNVNVTIPLSVALTACMYMYVGGRGRLITAVPPT